MRLLLAASIALVSLGIQGCDDTVHADKATASVSLSSDERKEAADLSRRQQELDVMMAEAKNAYEANLAVMRQTQSDITIGKDQFIYRLKVAHGLPERQGYVLDGTKGVLWLGMDYSEKPTNGGTFPTCFSDPKTGIFDCK